jgi:hypothetical protein
MKEFGCQAAVSRLEDNCITSIIKESSLSSSPAQLSQTTASSHWAKCQECCALSL